MRPQEHERTLTKPSQSNFSRLDIPKYEAVARQKVAVQQAKRSRNRCSERLHLKVMEDETTGLDILDPEFQVDMAKYQIFKVPLVPRIYPS
jgi:hypothetical protein